MMQVSRPLCAGLERSATVSVNGTSTRQEGAREQLGYAATVGHFLEVSQAYLALRHTSGPALEVQYHSSGVYALPSTGHCHPVQQFQIGGEHVAR